MEQLLSHLSRRELEEIILILDRSHHPLVQAIIDEYQERKIDIIVAAIEIECDLLYVSLSSEQESKLKRILARDRVIRIDPCHEECAFCERYYGAIIGEGEVHYSQVVNEKTLEEHEELNQLLQEKLERILDEDDE
jgi:hypothetical protein